MGRIKVAGILIHSDEKIVCKIVHYHFQQSVNE